MSVDREIEALIDREGGYVDHPADRGGPTRFGITEQIARAYGYRGPMSDLPRGTAAAIYRERYWTGVRFDEVFLVFPRTAVEMFDTGVNMGQAVAARFLQRALNLLNRQSRDYPDIKVDGQVGRLTIASLSAFKKRRGAAGEEVLLKALECQQGARYMDLAEKDASQEAFLFGWLDKRIGDFL